LVIQNEIKVNLRPKRRRHFPFNTRTYGYLPRQAPFGVAQSASLPQRSEAAQLYLPFREFEQMEMEFSGRPKTA
jgi:glycyl-tRNA synthetase (class II)